MKKRIIREALAFCVFLFFLMNLVGQEYQALTVEQIQEFGSNLKLEGIDKALMNAATNSATKELALDRIRHNRDNNVFNFRIKTEGITNQKSSGRCWMFAALNMLRPFAMKSLDVASFEFSENYLFFWDKLEKANLFLDAIIATAEREMDDRELHILLKDPVYNGGWWNYVVELIEKYGIVPLEKMPETVNTEKSHNMNAVLNSMLRHSAVELRAMVKEHKSSRKIEKRKTEILDDGYRLLVYHLGEPPAEFSWIYADKDGNVMEKNYTPQQFYKEVVGLDLGNYVTLMDHPGHDANRHYAINFCRNMSARPNMHFINLPMPILKQLTLETVLDSIPVWFAADTRHGMSKDGKMAVGLYDYETLFDIDMELPKKELFLTGGSIPGHAMLIIGVHRVDGKPVKWLVENSWGTDLGNKGYWTMSDDWFDKYVYTVIIDKSRLPDEIRALLAEKPKQLPIWDPMRAAFVNR